MIAIQEADLYGLPMNGVAGGIIKGEFEDIESLMII